MKRTCFLLLLLGCSDRVAVDEALTRTKSLVFRWMFDDGLEGGSYVFTFETDGKETVCVKVPRPVAGTKQQDFWVWVEPKEAFELRPGSSREELLLGRLQTCSIGPIEKPDLVGNPSRARVDWLLARLKDRELKWTPMP